MRGLHSDLRTELMLTGGGRRTAGLGSTGLPGTTVQPCSSSSSLKGGWRSISRTDWSTRGLRLCHKDIRASATSYLISVLELTPHSSHKGPSRPDSSDGCLLPRPSRDRRLCEVPGIELNSRDNHQFTALHFAVWSNKPACVQVRIFQLLIRNRVDQSF